jgi:NAD(P)-dependent dehydrogenase (short-subunit alcohol dehydrogenase family)
MSKVTLITGTSTGIGRATALHMARMGYEVIATMRDPQRSGDALRDAAKGAGVQLTLKPLDVTDAAAIERCVADIEKTKGPIDVLVNNAGIGELWPVERTSDAFARATFETNFFGPLRLIQAVLPGMRERTSGTIVNVSSIAGRIAVMGQSMYSASGFALEALSEALAIEVRAFNIRVALIEPGVFRTEMVGRAAQTQLDPDSPYAAIERRAATVYAQGLATTAGDPQAVAETIERAVATDEPKLRYTVGADAVPFLSGRERISDEEWIEFGAPMSDEEYWALFTKTFPMPAR